MTNREMFARAGCEAMLEAQARRRQLRCFGHVLRHDSLEHTIMLGMMAGQKRQGGQHRQWINDISNWTSTTGSVLPAPNGRISEASTKTIPELVSLASDREVWRRAVHGYPNLSPRVG